MKRILTVCILGIMGSFLSLNASPDLTYFIDVATFYDHEDKPYMEFYLDVVAGSLKYQKQEDGKFDGKVGVELKVTNLITQEEVYVREFELLNPDLTDTSRSNLSYGILDVRRIALDPGNYAFTGKLRDLNLSIGKTFSFRQELSVEEGKKELCYLSDMTFIQSFTPTRNELPHSKHGYDILPFVTNGTYVDSDSLLIYLEAYNANKESEKIVFANVYLSLPSFDERLGGYSKTIKMKPEHMNIITTAFNISELPSNTYYVHVDLYSNQNKLIGETSERFFVSNSRIQTDLMVASASSYDEYFSLDEKDLDYYIQTLTYISTDTERDFVRALQTEQQKQLYFLNFWERRKEKDGDSPAKAWLAYKSRVEHANKRFKASYLEGWQTDRGRIMLIYGAPNDVERFPIDNNRYAYQIWRYNKIVTQANVQFIFANLNEATSEYEMIHSTRLGELNNPRWQYQIVRNSQQQNLNSDRLFDN